MTDVRTAALKTFEFFEQHPDCHMKYAMAEAPASNPYWPEATHFCWLGRFARELGQLPEDERVGDYEEGYTECARAGVRYEAIIGMNDVEGVPLDHVLNNIRQYLHETGLI
jgi:hypothetical protein